MDRQALVRNGRSDNPFRIGYIAAPQLLAIGPFPCHLFFFHFCGRFVRLTVASFQSLQGSQTSQYPPRYSYPNSTTTKNNNDVDDDLSLQKEIWLRRSTTIFLYKRKSDYDAFRTFLQYQSSFWCISTKLQIYIGLRNNNLSRPISPTILAQQKTTTTIDNKVFHDVTNFRITTFLLSLRRIILTPRRIFIRCYCLFMKNNTAR